MGSDHELTGKPPVASKSASPSAPADDKNTGTVLRTVYQQTVDEAIPSEMLDLLGKLN